MPRKPDTPPEETGEKPRKKRRAPKKADERDNGAAKVRKTRARAARPDARVADDAEPVDAQIVEEDEIERPVRLLDGEDEDEDAALGAGDVEPGSLVSVGPLQAYMREVGRYPLLTREEEHELAVYYSKTQDPEAAAKLVTSNLRLVVKIAMDFQRAFINLMDLIQEGNIGLMQAVSKFDPFRGVKLSSYAAWWIRAYILRYILNNWRMVKIGTTQAQRKLFFNLQKEKERLEAQGFTPTPKLLAARLDVREKDIIEMDQRLSRPDLSMDMPLSAEEGGTTIGDLQPSPRALPDEALVAAEAEDIYRAALNDFEQTLDGKELEIFQERMLGDPPATLQELGDRYGITRERVRQIEARIMKRLRAFFDERGIEAPTSEN
ncbi:RNA polymerase factor sigma-32 [bacterium]|nr:RNA polymerase factor sigma-32 [bacterium]